VRRPDLNALGVGGAHEGWPHVWGEARKSSGQSGLHERNPGQRRGMTGAGEIGSIQLRTCAAGYGLLLNHRSISEAAADPAGAMSPRRRSDLRLVAGGAAPSTTATGVQSVPLRTVRRFPVSPAFPVPPARCAVA